MIAVGNTKLGLWVQMLIFPQDAALPLGQVAFPPQFVAPSSLFNSLLHNVLVRARSSSGR
jgi:hypothetical protein